MIFIECFAGDGALTRAVERIGFHVDPPQDMETGGVDFSCEQEVTQLWRRWDRLKATGFKLVFHFAPPCSTFSRARDRSSRTRLRSPSSPQGIDPEEPKTKNGNEIARLTGLSIKYLTSQLGACGSLEQPAASYMLPFLDNEGLLGCSGQVYLNQCRFGRPYKKPTVFLTFGGLDLSPLAKVCRGQTTCGRPFHMRLGFGEGSTSAAAAYPSALCASYAGALYRFVTSQCPRPDTAVERLTISIDGKLRRHVDRGISEPSIRERRQEEDRVARAGGTDFLESRLAVLSHDRRRGAC